MMRYFKGGPSASSKIVQMITRNWVVNCKLNKYQPAVMKYFLLANMLWLLYSCDGGRNAGSSATPEIGKDSVPGCIRELIDKRIKEAPGRTLPLQVDEYLYNGKSVFLVTEDCCDQFNDLYDADCTLRCAASGGFTGKGDGKCPGFAEAAKLVKTVWKKEAGK